MERKKRNTLILALALAVLLGAGLLIQKQLLSGPGRYAVVRLEGRELYRLDLEKECTVTVPSLDGGYNVIQVEDGAVWVTDADCYDLTCVRTGRAAEPGQVIACLPHRLIIFIQEGE